MWKSCTNGAMVGILSFVLPVFCNVGVEEADFDFLIPKEMCTFFLSGCTETNKTASFSSKGSRKLCLLQLSTC